MIAPLIVLLDVAAEIAPLLLTVNFVTPEALAVIKSPLFTLFTLNAALFPIPPETERTAGVFVLLPTYAPELASVLIIVFPVPVGVKVRDPFAAPEVIVRFPLSLIWLALNV